jgi:phage N-6-adenine-methyltransferase
MPSLGNETTVSTTDVWLTPPHILEALGPFDLDPCSSEDRPWDTAKTHYTIKDDGLRQEWSGRVWCNPPYGPKMGPFLSKLAAHSGGGTALIFARTETKAFFDQVWDKATAILFIKGRLKFHKPNGELGGTAGSPSVLIAYGEADAEILKSCNINGKYIRIR